MKKECILFGTVIAILIFLGIVLFGCYNGLVFVDGKLAPSVTLHFDDEGKHILVPVVATLCELGYEKISENNNIILLQNEDQILTVDLNTLSLTRPQSQVNHINIMPGNKYYFCERKGNDILLDSVNFSGTLAGIDCNYIIALDDPQYRIIKYRYHERVDFEQFLEEYLETIPEESLSSDIPDIVTKGRLIVNGVDITEGNYVYIHHGVENTELPLLATLRALGYDAQMQYDQSRDIYESNIDGYIGSFSSEFEDFDIPLRSGERGCVRKIVDNDFIVDSNCIISTLYWSFGAKITVDFDTSTIYIDSRDDWPYAAKE